MIKWGDITRAASGGLSAAGNWLKQQVGIDDDETFQRVFPKATAKKLAEKASSQRGPLPEEDDESDARNQASYLRNSTAFLRRQDAADKKREKDEEKARKAEEAEFKKARGVNYNRGHAGRGAAYDNDTYAAPKKKKNVRDDDWARGGVGSGNATWEDFFGSK